MITSEIATTVINGKRQFCRVCRNSVASYVTTTRTIKNYDYGTTTRRSFHTCAKCVVAGAEI